MDPTNPGQETKGLDAIERAIREGYTSLADGSPETVMAYARGVAHVAYSEGRKFERRRFWPDVAKKSDEEAN